MMLSRAAARAAGPSVNRPRSSGPRWRSVAIIRRRRSGSGAPPVNDTKPAIPHISLPPAHRGQRSRRDSGQLFERFDDTVRDPLGGFAVEELALLLDDTAAA